MTDEATKWGAVAPVSAAALAFSIDFLGCRKGSRDDQVLDATAKARLQTILRAVSWVESKHATAGPNFPERDPIQTGNPGDAWWKELTGQSGNGSRFIRGPDLSNLWANEVAANAAATAGFDASAAMSKLANKNDGHRNASFSPHHSYYWGTIYLVHRTNTAAGDSTYQCKDLSRARLVNGAVAYNGKGDLDYRTKIEQALQLIGDLS